VTPAHVPVMTERVLALLGPALLGDAPVLVDATVGLGGHTEAFLTRHPTVRVVGMDRDQDALAASAARLSGYADRVTLVHAVYNELPAVLRGLGLESIQAVLFDLGVSSMQLDAAERGFAYSQDAPLDMRMDATAATPTAAEVVNTYSAAQLAAVLKQYGEERFARRIADAIVAARTERPIAGSAELAELVRSAIPAAARRTGGHPAKRTFQALRIEVNSELAVLAEALPAALDALAVGGRIAVLSYQSLEDRIVKQALAAASRSTAPLGLPVVPADAEPRFELLTRGAEKPDEGEVADNPRAASARLRAAVRLREAA
jgi:16S rRNA (cytosine1402-N4)-methyltransferase